MKNFFLKNLQNTIGISLSEKSYKIVGLKCKPEELPESLYFMLSDNVFFKIPYIANQNSIIEHSLEKNIALVGKILSYFELEEVTNILTQEIENKVKLKEFMHNSVYTKTLNINKMLWFNKIIKSIEHAFKNGKLSTKLGYFGEKITQGDVDKYFEFKNNITSFNNLIDGFINGTIKLGVKSKRNKPEDSFPNSLKKLFIEFLNSYDYISKKCEEQISFISKESLDNINSSSATRILCDLLCFSSNLTELTSDITINIMFEEEDENKFDTIYDVLNYQFGSGFKYTEKNIEIMNDVARIFTSRYARATNNIDNGTPFNSEKEIISFAKELFSNVDIYNLNNYDENSPNSSIALVQIKDAMWTSLYNNVSAIDPSRNFSYGTNRVCMFMFLREPGMDVDYISLKYKDMINLKWSEELTRTVKFTTKDLKESIRHRYFLTSVTGTQFLDQRNMVVDTMLPQSLFSSEMNLEKTNRMFQGSQNINTKTAYAISPLTASAYGCKQIPIEHLCRILGFTKESIKSMMNTIKAREYNFVFVGAGGTGNNTAIWLSKMLDMVNLPYLFKNVHVFEKEAAEIHNLLRFPKDPYSITIDTGVFSTTIGEENSKNKCHIIAKEIRSLSRITPSCYERYIAYDESSSAYPSNVFMFQNKTEPVKDKDGNTIDFKIETKINPHYGTVFYGAPDITTRQNLSNVGNFISATHASNSCNVYINPEQDAMIQVESYGMIQLAPFFMNQLRMAIALLEILSDENATELLSRKDHEFLSYKFDGESKLKNDRVYNFKIIDNPEMATENQAVNLTALEF